MSATNKNRKMADIDEQLEVLFHGVDFGDAQTQKNMEKELRVMLAQDRPLKVYAGFDPTSVDLHLGHTLPMRKLKQFQEEKENKDESVKESKTSDEEQTGIEKAVKIIIV